MREEGGVRVNCGVCKEVSLGENGGVPEEGGMGEDAGMREKGVACARRTAHAKCDARRATLHRDYIFYSETRPVHFRPKLDRSFLSYFNNQNVLIDKQKCNDNAERQQYLCNSSISQLSRTLDSRWVFLNTG